MKNFQKWLTKSKNLAPYFAGMKDLNGLQIKNLGNGLIGFDQQTIEDASSKKPKSIDGRSWTAFLDGLNKSLSRHDVSNGIINLAEVWVLSSLFKDGVKTFCPTMTEFNALARTEIKVPISMYRQPFETFCVVIPDELFRHPVSSDVGTPAACVLRIDYEARVMASAIVGHDSSTYLVCPYTWGLDSNDTLEEKMKHVPNDELITDDEGAVAETIRRVSYNACLLLSQYTSKRLGSTNEHYRKRLEKSLNNRHLREDIRDSNMLEVKMIPEIYGLDQHIKVYDEVTASPGEATGEGVPHKPHWRRGHWAHQAFGEGRKERKLIFRKPTFVNAHLFAGELCNTRVSMSLGGQNK